MSSRVYQPNTNRTFPGPLKTSPLLLSVDKTGLPSSGCTECTSIYETMSYRSDFDKAFVPIYQKRVDLYDTNPLNLVFER